MASASSLPSQDEKQYLKSLLECSICLETFDDPRTLSCLHSFCKKCLENFVHGKSEDELNCPVCRTKFMLNKDGVSGMTRNHFICNMVEVLSVQDQDKSIPCTHCEQPSVGRCVTCEEFMCKKCMKTHNDYLGFRDHIVLTMEELSKPEHRSKIKKISKCSEHPKKKLKYYCETCDELICRHCMDFTHDKQHKFSPLEDAAKSKHEDLKKNCEILEKTVAKVKKETDDMRKGVESLNNNFEKTRRLISEHKEQLFAKVEKKANSMIEDARRIWIRKTKNIEENIKRMETFGNRVKATTDLARSLLQDGNDEEIIRTYKSVQENVNKEGKERNVPVEDDAVMPWSSDEIDTLLAKEIIDAIEKDAFLKKENEKKTSDEQWFFTDEGMQHLLLLLQYFQQAGITPDMSRDTYTQNMKFGLGTSGYTLDFPANFPERMPEIRSHDGSRYELKMKFSRNGDVCALLANTVVDILRKQQSHRYGHGGERFR